jgi:hypothetical protein
MSGLATAIAQVRERRQEGLTFYRLYVKSNFPDTIKALGIIDSENTRPKRRKGFSLLIRGGKYYARLSYDGRTLPTKFNCNTGNEREAEQYILKNKGRLIKGYLSRKDGRTYKTLEGFYNSGQDNLSEAVRKRCTSMVNS